MFSRKATEDIPEVNTAIWICSSEKCNGWMRDNFSFDKKPSCPLCQSEMKTADKMLPVLVNHIRP